MDIFLSAYPTDETTTGASDGTITLSAILDPETPGVTYTFTINNSGVTTSVPTLSDTYTFVGLTSGVYQCTCAVGSDVSRVSFVPIATSSPTPDPDPPTPPVPIVYEYRDRYVGSFCDKKGVNIVVTFRKRTVVGSIIIPSIDIQFAGESDSPVSVDYPDNGDYKLNPINGSQCEIRIKAIGEFELSSMYTADEKEWQLEISGGYKWIGYLIPDSCIEPFASKPYDVSVRATDALGLLKDVPFQRDDLTKYKGYYSDKEVLRLCLAKTGLALKMNVAVNTYEALMQVDNDRSPLGQSYVNVEPFLNEDGSAMDCYEIMESILYRWSARLHQFGGRWQIVNVMEKSLGTVKTYQFNDSGFADGVPFMLGNAIVAGGQNRWLRPVGDTSFAKAFKQSDVHYLYGYLANKLFNGDFDIWTDKPVGLPDGWEMTGITTGTTLTRIQDGYPTSDYYVEIGTTGSGGLTHVTPVQIRQYDFPTISFDLLTESGGYGYDRDRYVSVYISNNDGMWFTEDGWKNSYRAYVTKKDGGDFKKQQKLQINVDPTEEDYLMTITILAVGVVSGLHFKTYINNVVINSGTGLAKEKNPIGETNSQVLLTPQTFISDAIEVLHSDDDNPTRTSGIIIATDQTGRLDDSTVYPFSSLWKRAGITEFRPLLSIISNTELRLHQRAYRIIDFEYIADWNYVSYVPIDINTLLTVDLLEGTFIFLSGTFELKSGIPRLKFAQVLTEEVLVNETLKMDYGG